MATGFPRVHLLISAAMLLNLAARAQQAPASAQPGSPTRAGVARVGVEQPGSPTYADLAYVGVEQQLPAGAQGVAHTAKHQSITQDLSYGASFVINVAPNLPRVTFRVIPDVEPNDQFGNATSIIRDVQVFSGDSLEPMQHLTGCEWFGMDAPPRGEEWFRAVDFNFDGYQDIYILTNWGATGNNQGCIWLYDPETRRFNFSQEFSDLGTFTLDSKHKTIITWANGGMAGGVHSAAKYKIAANRPVLVYDEKQEWDINKKQFHCVVKELRGSQMVTTHDDWGRTAIDSGPAACEHASRIF